MAREKFAGVADAGGDLGFAEVPGHRVPQSFPEFIAAMLNWNIRRRLYLCPDPWKLQENTIGSGLVSHARGMRHASHLQARCSGVASVLFSYSLRILLVFSSYSAPLFPLPSRHGCCKPPARVPRYGYLI